MNKILLLIFPFIAACGAIKTSDVQEKRKVSKIVYKNYTIITEEGEKNADIFLDSLMTSFEKEVRLDSTMEQNPIYLEYMRMSMRETLLKKREKEEVTEIINDTIWRYTIENGAPYKTMYHYDKIANVRYAHRTKDKTLIENQIPSPIIYVDYIFEEYPKERKKIMGYDCYKVIMTIKSVNSDEQEEFIKMTGKTIYELYVTDKLEAPEFFADNILGIQKYVPLSIRSWSENLSGIESIYEVQSIK
jgi:hypothetical protein